MHGRFPVSLASDRRAHRAPMPIAPTGFLEAHTCCGSPSMVAGRAAEPFSGGQSVESERRRPLFVAGERKTGAISEGLRWP